jgi:hypothetical protein
MKYMLNIYSDVSLWDDMTPEAMSAELQAYGEFDAAVEKHGAFVAGEGLQGPETATTVRVRDGERLVTDGPFAETKEQLGGFYVLECKDLDEAIEWAAKIPGAQNSTIEIRPVIDYDA